MNIKVNNVEYDRDVLKLLVEMENVFSGDTYRIAQRIQDAVIDHVVKTVADEYLKINAHVLLSKIDQQSILNLITLRCTSKIMDHK